MNDLEHIREAVVLADGWKMIDELDLISAPFGVIQTLESLGKGYKAALAAQLVSQVDALEDVFFTESCGPASIVWTEGRRKAEVAGLDRATNTITAIIVSGVLK